MAKFVRHLFVCTNRRPADAARPSCAGCGSEAVLAALKAEVAKAGLKGVVRVNEAKCLDQCEAGCTAVVYPEATWYGHLTVDDVPGVARHLVHGEIYTPKVLSEEQVNARVGGK